jgi:hypothetical protein
MSVIKRAVEKIDGRVTVIGFNNGPFLMGDPNQPEKLSSYVSYGATGGTNPIGALQEAMRIFHLSRRKSLILFVLTDGAWSMSTQADEMMKKMGDAGVTTALYYLDTQSWGAPPVPDRHEAKVFVRSDKPEDLIVLADQVVSETMKAGKG